MEPALVGQIIIALGSIGGLYITYQKINKNAQDKWRTDIDGKASKVSVETLEKTLEDNATREYVDSRIELLKQELDHQKDTYSSEIKNLSEKIEDLRDDLREQHSKTLELLTKMVGSD